MPEPIERQQRELLELVGTCDPASPAFRARVDELLRSLREPGALPKDPARLKSALALNALLRDAVRREQGELAELMQQVSKAREALAQAGGPAETGDSCDVSG